MSYVADVLSGRVYLECGPYDRSVMDPLVALWTSRGPRRDEIHQGFREALTDEHPRARAGAARFFAGQSTGVVDLDLLLDALEGHPELYDGLADPFAETTADVRSVLASAIAFRAPLGHDRAIALLKAEALLPGRAGWVIAGLIPLDPVWVRNNAAALLEGSPDALDPLLFNLNMRDVDTTTFLSNLRGLVDDDVLRAGIRSALGERAAEVEAAVFGS